MLDLHGLQETLKKWRAKQGFPRSVEHVLLHAVQEISEVYDACSRRSKKRIGHELADVIILLLDIADWYNVDIERSLEEKVKIVLKRRYIKNKRGFFVKERRRRR